jgi:hypothetical protein
MKISFFQGDRSHSQTATYVLMVTLPFLFKVQVVTAQEKITDQVAVIILNNQILAATPDEGFARVELAAGERVLETEARGLNAFVQTSTRLLGFSGKLQRWAEQRTDLSEQVIEKRITPRLIFVRTNKRVYGFLGAFGQWRSEELGSREEPREVTVTDHLAVMVTERRALAFSAFTGGFFSIDLHLDERVTDTAANDNIIILTTPARRLVFRSQLRVWAELR